MTVTEPDHDMELVERLARIHHEALSPNHSWAGLRHDEHRTYETAMRAVLAELFPGRSPFAGRHDLSDLDDRRATFRRIVRLVDAQVGGVIDLTIDRDIWARWGRPLDVFVTTLVLGPS